MRRKIDKMESEYMWKLAWLKTLGEEKKAKELTREYKMHRISTYIKDNKWWILLLLFLLVCIGYTGLEIYIGLCIGVY